MKIRETDVYRKWFAKLRDAVAKAEGMSAVARRTGLGRESLYKALSPDGNPALSTILKVIRSLDLNLRAACL